MNIEEKLSQRTQNMRVTVTREILKVASQKGMISLAGGLPAKESFPLEIIRQLSNEVLDQFGTTALQYDKTEGFEPLREALITHLQEQGLQNVSAETIRVLSGSQSTLDLVGKILITPGDVVVIEAPSYLGAISAFNAYEPRYVTVATDDDGLIPDALEAILRVHDVKMVYTMPTFQNPTGRTIPLERRQRIAELIQQYDVLLYEDDPYGALIFEGEALPTVQQFAPDHVIYSSTFSKVLAPGLRIGYCVAPQRLCQWLTLAKQGTDLHTQTFGQAIAALYLRDQHLSQQISHIRAIYRERRDAMLDALQAHMPEGFRWTQPKGGMFIWVETPEGFSVDALYEACIVEKVAFVPGKYCFYDDGAGLNTMRLNFSSVPPETITQAVTIIGRTAHSLIATGSLAT